MTLFLGVLLSLFLFTNALIHELDIKGDNRNIFKIETFGFLSGGSITIDVRDFAIRSSGKSDSKDLKYKAGFILRHSESENDGQQDLEGIIERNECIFEKQSPQDLVIDLSNTDTWQFTPYEHTISDDAIGLYSLVFARCEPSSTNSYVVDFKLKATFANPGPNYLSAGDLPLPTLYLIFSLCFLTITSVWVYVLRRNPAQFGKIHNIHYMMLGLLVFKCFSIFFESIRYHYIALYGVSEMWSILYYIFTFLKGIMLFVVILLIGSGYSLMKNYLHDNEKKIIWIVLVLQVIDNIAMIVLEETSPGSQGWLTWRDILHIVDILCCLAILLPIVWSIRHLRQAAEVDGKAHHNLMKLQLFRSFYIMVVVYIYFTRIAILLLAATVPFYLLWLGPLFTELATLIFFIITGYQFQPALDNPYLLVQQSEDAEGSEYGLDDHDDEVDVEKLSGISMSKMNK